MPNVAPNTEVRLDKAMITSTRIVHKKTLTALIQIEAKITPAEIERVIELQKDEIPLIVSFRYLQATFGEIKA